MEVLGNTRQTSREDDRKIMEFLGHSSTEFSRDRDTRRWEPFDIYYQSQESFCDATSKLLSGMKDGCRFIVANDEGERHFVDVLDVRYDSTENRIRIFPENCKRIKK